MLAFPLNPFLPSSEEDIIGFLNEIQISYPDAISMATGQPDYRYFDARNLINKIRLFTEYSSAKSLGSKDALLDKLCLYGKTKGIVNNLIAEYVRNDIAITADAEDIIVSNGSQEGLLCIVAAMCGERSDVILMESPGYIGLSALAQVFNYRLRGVNVDETGLKVPDLENAILQCVDQGLRVKLLYVNPDFQNPTGSVMSKERRLALLSLAKRYNFFIIEDSTYTLFNYGKTELLSLKSMDTDKRVIFIHSFSKILFPALRVGFIIADQIFNNGKLRLSDAIAKVKGRISLNTSSINQSIVAGVLLENNFSLKPVVKPKVEEYSKKKTRLFHVLAKHIDRQFAGSVTWNKIEGGFFVIINLPFDVDKNDVDECARRFGVVICPLSCFYVGNIKSNEIRLAFVHLTEDEIDEGVRRLSAFLAWKFSLKDMLSTGAKLSAFGPEQQGTGM